jgi:hypothetical protein
MAATFFAGAAIASPAAIATAARIEVRVEVRVEFHMPFLPIVSSRSIGCVS